MMHNPMILIAQQLITLPYKLATLPCRVTKKVAVAVYRKVRHEVRLRVNGAVVRDD